MGLLRQYDIAEKLVMQDWTVELRRRLQGAHEGDIYLVFMDRAGRKHYTMLLGRSFFLSGGFD